MKKVLIVLASLALLASCGQPAPAPVTEKKSTGAAMEASVNTVTPTENTMGTSEEAMTPSENTMEAGSATSKACESYLAYLECTAKQTGVDANIDQVKRSFEALGATESENMCQEGLNAIKAMGQQVAGCEVQ